MIMVLSLCFYYNFMSLIFENANFLNLVSFDLLESTMHLFIIAFLIFVIFVIIINVIVPLIFITQELNFTDLSSVFII